MKLQFNTVQYNNELGNEVISNIFMLMESFLGGWAYEKLLNGDDGLVNGDEKRKFFDFLLKYGAGNGFLKHFHQVKCFLYDEVLLNVADFVCIKCAK